MERAVKNQPSQMRNVSHPSAPNLKRDQPLYVPQKKQQVPRASERMQLKDRNDKNMVKDNMMKVIFDNQAKVKKEKSQIREQQDAEIKIHKNYGKVPKYIDRYNS